MPVDSAFDKTGRQGTYVDAVFIVPPDIAFQIDKEAAENPLFPDRLFQNTWGPVGEDTHNRIKRQPAKNLITADFRGNKTPTPVVRPYPQPLPY